MFVKMVGVIFLLVLVISCREDRLVLCSGDMFWRSMVNSEGMLVKMFGLCLVIVL